MRIIVAGRLNTMTRKLTLALAAAIAAAPLAAASAGPPAKTAYHAPRTSFGQPDLMGYWSNSSLTPIERKPALGDRSAYTPEEVKKLEAGVVKEIAEGNKPTAKDAPVNAPNGLESRPEFVAAGGDVGGYNRGWLDPGNYVMRVGGEPRTSLITTKDGRVPAAKGGGAAGERYGSLGSFDSYETRSLGERCIIGFGRNAGPPMLPNGFYNNNYRIVQTPDQVAIEVEMVHDLRIVRLNAKHRTDGQRPWFGDSIGWWDGDTLVVETTNIPEKQAFYGAWKTLKITERFTRVGKDRLRYAFQVSDPSMWDAAWGGEYEFAPLNGMIYEYACHEGNYALPGILAGARAQEKAGKVVAPTKGDGGEGSDEGE
jgi:hypothetical protein